MGTPVSALIGLGGSVFGTINDVLGKNSSEDKYYKQMANAANLQAAQTEQNAKRQGDYMFMDAAQQNTQLSRDYSTLLGQQKTAMAAGGLGSGSATAQSSLKNSRLNALLDQETLQYNINSALYENNTTAALEALNLRLQANQYDRARKNKTSLFGRVTDGLMGSVFK